MGEIVIRPKYENAYNFSEGLALVLTQESDNESKSLYGFINDNEEFVIKPKFNNGFGFSQGLAAVSINGNWGYIDKSGSMKIDAIYDRAYPFSENLALVELNNKQLFINKKGLKVFEPKCDKCVSGKKYFDGLIKITINNKDGFMDKKKCGNRTIIILFNRRFFRGFS